MPTSLRPSIAAFLFAAALGAGCASAPSTSGLHPTPPGLGRLPYADADYSQLDQVMANLLENAARHAPPGSQIHVRGRDAGHDRVEFSVEDEGAGIPSEDRSRAFEPFQRGANSTGSGVGLAICRAIVDANGGTISIEDGATGGARVVVRLPVRHG